MDGTLRSMMDEPVRITICGGGASAVLALAALQRRLPVALDVTIVEPREELGLGVAYSSDCALHLLNTRARNMSVTADPDDFYNWLRRTQRRRPLNWTRDCFAPRALYGQYLQARLLDLRAAPNLNLRVLRSTVDSIVESQGAWQVVPAKGAAIDADVVILATGNEAPRALSAGLAPEVRPLVIDDPWDRAAKAAIGIDEPVLLVGTGLTAVDIAIELLHRGHRGGIYATSRRGLLPRVHGALNGGLSGAAGALPTRLPELVRFIAAVARSDPRGRAWQALCNELRVMAPALWSNWNVRERRQFLRHVRPFWDVHRHRIAPQLNMRLSRAADRGQFEVMRGRIADVQCGDSGALRVQLRQASGVREFEVGRIINCTGPEADPRCSENTLLRSVLSDGLAQPDVLGLGLCVDRHSRLIDARGCAQQALFAIGSLTRGARWEVTSIAELRDQAHAIARQICKQLSIPQDRVLHHMPVSAFRHAVA